MLLGNVVGAGCTVRLCCGYLCICLAFALELHQGNRQDAAQRTMEAFNDNLYPPGGTGRPCGLSALSVRQPVGLGVLPSSRFVFKTRAGITGILVCLLENENKDP